MPLRYGVKWIRKARFCSSSSSSPQPVKRRFLKACSIICDKGLYFSGCKAVLQRIYHLIASIFLADGDVQTCIYVARSGMMVRDSNPFEELTMSPVPQKRLLVVDDDPAVCESIRMALASEGYAIVCTHDAEHALRLAERGHFDLILADYVLPKADGFQLAKIIKSRAHCPAVIMLTGYPVEKQGGAVDSVVLKPFSVQALRYEVAQLLSPLVTTN